LNSGFGRIAADQVFVALPVSWIAHDLLLVVACEYTEVYGSMSGSHEHHVHAIVEQCVVIFDKGHFIT
jgi:hypothetical protein